MIRTTIVLLLLLSISITADAAYQLKFISEMAIEKPIHVAPDQSGNIYVTTKKGGVSVHSPDGKSLFTMARPATVDLGARAAARLICRTVKGITASVAPRCDAARI